MDIQTIREELNRIATAKADIIAAIINKGVSVPEDVMVEDLAEYIRSIGEEPPDPNPLGLPSYTIRLKFSETDEDGHPLTPKFNTGKGTAARVSSSPNVWDWTYENNDWSSFVSENLYCQYYLLEVLGANTSNVTKMDNLFDNCAMLEKIAYFDTSKVTSMASMFNICNKLTEIPKYDTSNVTNMRSMFDSCDKITTIPKFNTSKVTDMSYMFSDCRELTTVPNLDTSNVTNMAGMFQIVNGGNNKLLTVPTFNTSKVTDMSAMFNNCYALTTVPNFDTTNVTNMASMFYYCSSLTTTPQLNTSKVINMNSMFKFCTNLKNILLFDTTNVTNTEDMFQYCRTVESGALAFYQQVANQATPPVYHTRMFNDCGVNTQTGAAELEQIPSGWK